jgi:tetratricopeptide (TPR) repeat protein
VSEDQVKQFIEQATQSLQSGQFQSALEFVDQAIALNPNDSESHVLRGISLSQLNRPDEATDAFRAAILHGPYNPKAYYNLAVHYYSLGQKVQAEEMAKETIRIDPRHTGGRELLAKIEGERAPSTVHGTAAANPFPGDPLAPQPTEAPGGTQEANRPYGGGAPTSGPYSQPPQATGYYRGGYDNSNVNSIQFVANMGKNWDTIGWVLAGVSTVLYILAWVIAGQQMMQMFQNPQAAQDMNMMGTGAQLVLNIISFLVNISAMVWMIMELANRRGNWLWLVPFILCCCCSLPGIPMAIYMAAGRQK